MSDTITTGAAPLEGITVLDLSGALGNYCGKLYADLGADVILVEPPGGASTRRMAPLVQGRSDPEASLYFQYNNTNKRSLVLDLEQPQGQEVLRTLAARADLLIETERPGVMQARGLGYPDLRAIAPQLVVASITPFGQSGPYAQWQAEDIVGLALGGMLSLGGYFDGPPMAAYGYQAFAASNLFGAVASLAAVYEAEASGSGQHVDVSMQECVVMGMENAVQFYDLEGTIRRRNAGQQRQAGMGVFACKDGSVYLMAGGVGANRFWGNTVQWLVDGGVPGAERLRDSCWTDLDFLTTDAAREEFKSLFGAYARRKTKLELYAEGQARRVPIAPVADTSDILQSAQLKYRGFFAAPPAGHAGVPAMTMPGAPYKMGASPWSLRRGAPALGQHTGEILSAAGIDGARQAQLQRQGIIG